MNEVLQLNLPMDVIAPVILGERYLEESSRVDLNYYKEKVLKAYEKVSEGKDIMIMEGPGAFGIGTSVGIDPITLVKRFNSRILVVSSIEDDTTIDRIIWDNKSTEVINKSCIGIILNLIPKTDLERVKGYATPVFKKHNVDVLGIIPEHVEIKAPTVKEICEVTKCKILTRGDKLDNLIEEFLVGAMTPESALTYFRRSLRKGVITGGDRTDIQLSALQTDTSALILTGNFYPDVRVIARAEELGVPVLLVPYDTYSTVRKIGSVTGRIASSDTKKIELAKKLVNDYVDWQRILRYLGSEYIIE